jgi:hypothetical protein
MTNTEYINTHNINVGDTILAHGMVLYVDTEPRQTNHKVTEYGGETLSVAAVVTNYSELVVDAAENPHGTAAYVLRFIDSDMSPYGLRAANGLAPYTEPRWTIQGNGLAEWNRATR